MSFEANDSREMGLKLFKQVGSSEGFLSMGVTSACLSGEGKVLEERERLKMWVREFRIEFEGGRNNCEGTGSRGQVARWAVEMSLSTSSVVTGQKEESIVLDLMCWVGEEVECWISPCELC